MKSLDNFLGSVFQTISSRSRNSISRTHWGGGGLFGVYYVWDAMSGLEGWGRITEASRGSADGGIFIRGYRCGLEH